MPRAARVGFLASSADPQGARFVDEKRVDGVKLGFGVHPIVLKNAAELDGALAATSRARLDALIVQPLFANDEGARPRIIDFMVNQRLPTMSDPAVFAEKGGPMAFGADGRVLLRQLAGLVDKVLKGAKPGDLPVQEATTFELVINTRAARSIGLAIPPSVLLRANRVIE